MDRFQLLHYLLLLLLASVVAARRHHSGSLGPDRGGDKGDGRGPAWEARRNDWTKGTDLLDWSRDPRRVDPKVYTFGNHPDCGFSIPHWPYAVAGQLEGQEWPAGLVKGEQVEPKSKVHLALCGDGPRYKFDQDLPHPRMKYYFARNAIRPERIMPLEECPKLARCFEQGSFCATTYTIDNPSETEYINGPISGNLSGRVEQLLRDYGPMAVFVDSVELDQSGFLEYAGRCSQKALRDFPGNFGPPYIGYRSFPQDSFLLVGYGRTDDGVGYFKFKYSLGPEWGDNGFGYFKYTSQESAHQLCGEIELWKIKPCQKGAPVGLSRARSRHPMTHSHREKSH